MNKKEKLSDIKACKVASAKPKKPGRKPFVRSKRVGRKPIPEIEKRKMYHVYLNPQEYQFLQNRIKQSRHLNISQYVRGNLIEKDRNIQHINPVDFLQSISHLGFETKKIGSNINQLAKRSNKMAKTGILEPLIVEAFLEQIEIYYKIQIKINDRLKEVLFA